MQDVKDYYASMAEGYSTRFYAGQTPLDPSGPYGDYIRLWPVFQSLAPRRVGSVFEVGCGDGFVLDRCRDLGIPERAGCDLSPEMIAGIGERHRVFVGNLDDMLTLAPAHRMTTTGWAAVICLGVLPHVRDDRTALLNLRALGRPGTVYYIEIRNALFSLFTMNRYTRDFIVNDLLAGVPDSICAGVGRALTERLVMSAPPPEPTTRKFHNPETLPDLLRACGFGTPTFHYYHAHPTLPWIRDYADPEVRAAALALERPGDWRSKYLCSAAVIEVEAVG